MRPITRLQGLSIAACVATVQTLGCSFILDFDALQSGLGSPDTGAMLPPQSDAGSAGPGGRTDGGENCAKTCDDRDPCTNDRCVAGKCRFDEILCEGSDSCKEYQCVEGRCESSPIVGVVPDGYNQVISAPKLLRSELVVVGDQFYQATFGTFKDVRDVMLTTFDGKETKPKGETSLNSILMEDSQESSVVMGSAVSLVPEARPGRRLTGSILNAYVAARSGDKPVGDLLRLAFDSNLTAQLPGLTPKPDNPIIATPSNFQFVSERMGPSGGTLATGQPFVVWAGAGPSQSGVYLQTGNTVADTATPTFPETTAVSGVSSILVGDVPGAIWMTNNNPNGVQVKTALVTEPPSTPSQVFQCHREDDFVGYHLDVSQSIGDIWTVTWTKRKGTEYVTEVSSLLCVETGCTDLLADTQSCSAEEVKSRVFRNTRNLLTRTLHREGDPDTKVHRALLSATQYPDKVGGSLSLQLDALELDLSDDGDLTRTVIGSVALDSSDTVAGTPSWPTLALLPPDKIAVAWIKPQAKGQTDELHVQRHRICFPE